MHAGRLLRSARIRAGFSQRELSSRSGITQTSISQIESGKTSPRFATLDQLIATCGFELELVPRIGIGIDRTGMRELLRLAPAERAKTAVQEARKLEELPTVSSP